MAGTSSRRLGSRTLTSQRSAASFSEIDRPLLVLEPGLVLVQVVEQEPRLALEGDEPGQPLELAGVEPPVGDRDLEPDDVLAVPGRLERDLVDREAELVEPADAGADRVPVVGGQLGLEVELVPDRRVASANGLGRLDRIVGGALATLHRPEVGQTERDVLDEDVEVVFALAVRQRRVDLARLGVDEEGLDLVAVTTEERVGERAIAPEHAGSVEVHEQPRHRVEQPVAVRPRAEREAHEQAAVLDRELQVLGHEDGRCLAPGPPRARPAPRPAGPCAWRWRSTRELASTPPRAAPP